MYIYQDGKLYAQDGDKLVGVSITPTEVIRVEGTETKLKKAHTVLSPFEVQCKFQIRIGESYIFPKKELPKEVKKKNGTTSKTKNTSGKSNGK